MAARRILWVIDNCHAVSLRWPSESFWKLEGASKWVARWTTEGWDLYGRQPAHMHQLAVSCTGIIDAVWLQAHRAHVRDYFNHETLIQQSCREQNNGSLQRTMIAWCCPVRQCTHWHTQTHRSHLKGIRTNLEESSKCQPQKRWQ